MVSETSPTVVDLGDVQPKTLFLRLLRSMTVNNVKRNQMKANIEPLVPEHYYHVYNKGINGESIFKKEAHYSLFLDKYAYHVSPFIDTFAYCLMSNHFHLLVRVKSFEDILKEAELKYPGKKSVL